ncbi:MAG: hypothetical protein COA97_12510 [Flavobacteriales bacterium]|nr:MAG: hypothetical protein COA97_12510 [Flavobacteriales bacterium]
MKALFISIIIILFGLHSQAQDVYRTQNGNMVVTTISADTVLKITTKELLVLLNYQNAKFEIKMDKSTFYTGNDSLDKKLKLMKYEIIEFNGKLDLEYINTNGHPPLDFQVEGILSTNDNIITGTGHLEHISNRGAYSCLLTLKFNIKKDDLGLNLEGLNLKNDIQIEIVQIVLNKAEDQ